MKHLLWILLVLPAWAQQEKFVESEIKEVTVFGRQAEISRSGDIYLTPGNYTIILPGLSTQLQQNTLQANGTGPGIIQSVAARYNYLNMQPKSKKFSLLEDSLKLLDDRLTDIGHKKWVLEKEEKLIKGNRSLEGKQGIDAVKLQELLKWQRTRLTQIVGERRKLTEAETDLKKTKARLNNQLKTLNAEHNQPSYQVEIDFKVNAASKFVFELNYLVNNAGWNAMYDLRTQSDAAKVDMSMKANLVNGTGIDWSRVRIKLSTAQPSRSADAPELYAWYLSEYSPGYYGSNLRTLDKISSRSLEKKADAYGGEGGADNTAAFDDFNMSDFTSVESGQLSKEYVLEIRQDIPADGKPYTVDIQKIELPCAFVHFAAPKADPTSYMQAAITGWEQYELLGGSANVYLDNTFISTTYIDPQATTDTLRLGLGQDSRVLVMREEDKKFTSRKTVGAYIKAQQKYTITVRNNKGKAVSIRLEDQIPVSSTNEIDVKLLEDAGAKHSEKTGKLTWDLNLAPGEKKELTFSFEVKHKKDIRVIGL